MSESVISPQDGSSLKSGVPTGTNRPDESSVSSATEEGDIIACFSLGEQHFGLSVEIVGEVVTIDDLIRVPKAPLGVKGLFNLRGTPVALVDLATALNLRDATRNPRQGQMTGLVIRPAPSTVLAAIEVDSVQSVVSTSAGHFVPKSSDDELPSIQGFLEIPNPDRVVTVLDANLVLEGLQRLQIRS